MSENEGSFAEYNAYLRRHHYTLWLAINHHRTHNGSRITFEKRDYAKAVYLDDSDHLVIKKSSQCGISEYLIIRTMVKASMGRSVFYVLPTYGLQGRFVRNRFDKSIEYSAYYRGMVRADNKKTVESVSLKRVGKGTIAFVGSNASSGFVEFPADELIIDELDQCSMEHLPMADGRLSNSTSPARVKISNPSLENYGIDEEYAKSDKKLWYVPCSSCGKIIQPDFFTHVVRAGEGERNYYVIDPDWDEDSDRDILPICDRCGKPFDRFCNGEWVPQERHSKISGYHITKMFSTKVSLRELVERFNEGLENENKLQAFYNFDLGIAFSSSGSKITYSMLDDCVGHYPMASEIRDGSRCFMGVDVGTYFHWVLGRWVEGDTGSRVLQVVAFGKEKSKEELLAIVKRYYALIGVIDGLPEARISKEICTKLKYWLRAYYTGTKAMKVREVEKEVHSDRTMSLDEVKELLITKRLMLPLGSRMAKDIVVQGGVEVSEFYQNLTSSTRVFNEDRQVFEWVHSEPDHYFHAMNYMVIASKIMLMLGSK